MPTLFTTYEVTTANGETHEFNATPEEEAAAFPITLHELIAISLGIDGSTITKIEPKAWKKLVNSSIDESRRTVVKKLQCRMIRLVRGSGVTEFTLEHGVGSTYGHTDAKPTLYGHGEYPSYSVNAGMNRRFYIRQFDSVDEARSILADVRIKYDDLMDDGGSTYVDIDTATAHLPDDQG